MSRRLNTRPFTRKVFSGNAIPCDFANRLKALPGWRNAWLGGVGSLNVAGADADSIALVGTALSGLFGVGSTLGMLLMSGLIGLPFALSGQRLTKFHYGLQSIAGSLTIAFGLWYAYQSGLINLRLKITWSPLRSAPPGATKVGTLTPTPA